MDSAKRLLLALGLLVGCSKPQGARPAAPAKRADNTQAQAAWSRPAQPPLKSLPVLPIGLSGYSERIAATEAPCSAPPSDTLHELNAWAKEHLAPCLQRKTSRALELEHELVSVEGVAAATSAAGLVGHLLENIAADLLGAPTPREVAADATLMALYRKTIAEKAAPFLERAHATYTVCAANAARAGADVTRWGEFCNARKAALEALLGHFTAPEAVEHTSGVAHDHGIIGVMREVDAGASPSSSD